MTIMTGKPASSFSVAEAKAKLSEVIEKAAVEGPQRITLYGRDAAFVVSAADWRARLGRQPAGRRPTMLEFFEPLRGSGLQIGDRGAPLGPAIDIDE